MNASILSVRFKYHKKALHSSMYAGGTSTIQFCQFSWMAVGRKRRPESVWWLRDGPGVDASADGGSVVKLGGEKMMDSESVK